jgi:hypothetical protein
MLLVECNVLEQVKVIKEGKEGNTRLRLRGKFQQCDEQNNNGRIYPRKILEAQVQAIQEKIGDRSLVGALDHPANDAIHLSQASHVITGLSVDKDGSVIGECEILSTPNGKIVEALINDGVKIGISSRGVGSVTEGIKGKIVNEDFKLITFDLVSDPSTRGAFPELTESIRENSQRAQEIVSKHRKERVLLTMLESKVNEALKGKQKKLDKNKNNKLDSQDFEILRNESESRVARQAAKMQARKKKIKAKQKGDTAAAEAAAAQENLLSSTEILGRTVVEAFKKVCWGDRYDERSEEAKMKRRQKKAGEEESAKQDPNLEIKAATQPERKDRYNKAMKKGGLAGARRAAARMERNKHLESPKVAKAKRMITKGATGVPPGPGDKKSSRTAMKYGSQNSSTEILGRTVVEAFKKVCWGDRYDEGEAKGRKPDRQDPKKDLKKVTTGVKPIKTKGKEHLYRGLPKTFRGYGTSQKDSIELFGDIIFETFAGLDTEKRARDADKVTKGLRKLMKKEKASPRIKPGGEEAAAQKLDILGQHALAAGTRGGAFTDQFSNKPSAAQRFSKHFQKRGAQGEHDIALARGLKNRNRGNKK